MALEVLDESAAHLRHPGGGSLTGTHFKVTIIAEAFAGLSLLASHRLIYKALGGLSFHALSITARAP